MPLPSLTPSARAEALARAVELRAARSALLKELKQGRIDLAQVLDRDDDIVGRIRVRRLLEALPRIGRVGADQLMRQLGIAASRRVAGIGPRQREKLLALFPTQPAHHE